MPSLARKRRTGGRTRIRDWLDQVDRLVASPDWPPEELPIEKVQTHISIVLLTRLHALKLKKPLNLGFLDYTTLAKRRRACEAELALNRRLCDDTYLEVRPIVSRGREVSAGGRGRIVDYGVWMNRLPAERMLDRLVAEGHATETMLDRVAERLNRFHREARRGAEVDVHASPDAIRRTWNESFAHVEPYVGCTISTARQSELRKRVARSLAKLEPLLARRIRERRVCDGHGDLRCESICMTDGIRIFDCIEFNDRFRCADVAAEVAFLAMDLDARGRPDLGSYFAESYQARAEDPDLHRVLPFFRCQRAYVRGEVLSMRLDEPEFTDDEKREAAFSAGKYFGLARRYAARLTQPTLVAMTGLSGTGKTAVARAVAGELGLRIVSSDVVRRELFAGGPPASGEFGPEANRRTYDELLARAATWFAQDRGVILDATFQRADDRRRVAALAAALGARPRWIECRLARHLVEERLARRAAEGSTRSKATWDVYLEQRERFEPWLDSGAARLAIDTAGSLSVTGHTAADWLREHDRPF